MDLRSRVSLRVQWACSVCIWLLSFACHMVSSSKDVVLYAQGNSHTDVEQIAYGSQGPKSAMRSVVRDSIEWQRIWALTHVTPSDSSLIPHVDFQKYMVLLVARGRTPTTGYDITVDSLRLLSDTLVVTVLLQNPCERVRNVITEYWDLVKVPRSLYPVRFEDRSATDCSQP